MRVLLVEDNPGDALLARRELENDPRTQFVVHEATSLHAALEHLAKRCPDVILVDLGLGDSTGLGTLRAIRGSSSASIVVLTGYDDAGTGTAAIDTGASDYVVKGTELRRLRSAVRFALARAQTSKKRCRDTTDRNRSEQYEKRLLHADRLDAIGQFAAGVAHEINNPATFVASNLHMAQDALSRTPQQGHGALENDSDWREVQHMLADGIAGIERIAKIVEDLQSFAQVDEGDVEWVDLSDVARQSRAVTENDLRHRAKVLESYEELPRIVADRRRLSQLVVSLLINAGQAIDARPQDDARISLRTAVQNDQLVLSVEDTGSGIAAQNIGRVFEPFFTTKSRGVGTGLGLSFSAETARNHGGELRVTSELHVGTCFDLVLPRETPFKPPPSAPESRPPIDDVSSEPRQARILLIDDEAMVRRALTRVLREHEVISCESVAGALHVLDGDEDFDLVICDLMMPEVGGEALYEALLERGSKLAQRFVIISGGAFTPRTVALAEAKRPTVIKKPIDHERLRHVVAHFTGAQAQES